MLTYKEVLLMQYAIVCYFDEETEKVIQKLIDRVAETSGNEYMIHAKIPPHITVCSVDSQEEKQLISKMDDLMTNMDCGQVCWPSIGIFNPSVLFLTSVLNEYLHKLNQTINQKLMPVAKAGDNGNYLPFHWIPHTAIATRLTEEQLKKAFEVVQSEFTPFAGKINRFVLARSNPYKEVKIWELPYKSVS